MSFSNGPRRSGSAGKGAPAKKKSAKKRQEFHSTKRRARQTEKLDLDKLKERTVSGLEHLGHQKFSGDKGSYGMEGWVKSLSLLLKDFESKLDEGQLTEAYASGKERLMQSLSTPVDTAQLEAKMGEVRTEEVTTRQRLDKENNRIVSRLTEIRTASERQSKEVEAEKAKLVQLNLERKSASVFSRMLGRGGPSTKPVETRLEELRSGLKSLEDEEVALNAARDSMERKGTDSPDPYAADWRRLNEIAEQIAGLEAELQEKLQREKERADAADALAKMVAEVKPVPSQAENDQH